MQYFILYFIKHFYYFFKNAVREESEKQWNISRRKLVVKIRFQDKKMATVAGRSIHRLIHRGKRVQINNGPVFENIRRTFCAGTFISFLFSVL